jgi:predicted nucleic acid-binding protein
MGAGSINDAVADTGPLIHLHEIDHLDLLHIVEHLHIPDAVWKEATDVVHQQTVPALDTLPNVIRYKLNLSDVTLFIDEQGLEHLHLGERESLYLSWKHTLSLVFTDDLAVRKAAQALDIRPVGSLEIIVRAYRVGGITLSEAQAAIRKLQEISSLFVTYAIVDQALRLLTREAS